MLTVVQAYNRFIDSLVPTQNERNAATSHRASVEGALRQDFSVVSLRETGSFTHGTGVRSYSDVDVLMRLSEVQPGSTSTVLNRLKSVLDVRFPFTQVKVRRPAVVVDFAATSERWEVIPGYWVRSSSTGYDVFQIPGPSGWIETSPHAHLDYVNASNNRTETYAGAKKLARMLKAWKYYNGIPVSSFYLEMRAAEHLRTQSSFAPIWDMWQVLNKLNNHSLASMNDPMNIAGRIVACSSDATRTTALSRLSTTTSRAEKALDAQREGNDCLAFYYLDLLYGRQFPGRHSG